jgi:hypothetical protein
LSHIPLRKENDCLNCGALVHGRYCHVCGQENVVPKETFWHMVTHFFYDITHFDSSFFHTVHHLIFKPGFLSSEYMKGRRMRYLHPIRMYVFSSAIFFLIFFSVFKPVTVNKLDDPIPPSERAAYVEKLQNQLKTDSNNVDLLGKLAKAKDTARILTQRDTTSFNPENEIINFTDEHFRSWEQFDSSQKAMPKSERHGWFMRRLIKKQIEINNKYWDRPDEALDKFIKSLLHRLPYMLFISLPLFAAILKLVYVRRKQFYYADHGVFTIHLYIFTFLTLLVIMSADKLEDYLHRNLFGWIIGLLIIGLFVYLYVAMKYFYGQGWLKTFAKFLIVVILSLMMMTALFLAFTVFSAVTF